MPNVTIKSPTDVLRELNEKLTTKIEEFDIFDMEIPKIRLKKFIEILVLRELQYVVTDFVRDNKITVTIGKVGANFTQHEANR